VETPVKPGQHRSSQAQYQKFVQDMQDADVGRIRYHLQRYVNGCKGVVRKVDRYQDVLPGPPADVLFHLTDNLRKNETGVGFRTPTPALASLVLVPKANE
jgi:hypothetical protein